jgi:hypothetical protein
MASERQANEARRQHGQKLIEHGAHAIGVEDGASYGKKGFVVVAHVRPNRKADIPSSLSCRLQDKEIDVPVVVARSQSFKLE